MDCSSELERKNNSLGRFSVHQSNQVNSLVTFCYSQIHFGELVKGRTRTGKKFADKFNLTQRNWKNTTVGRSFQLPYVCKTKNNTNTYYAQLFKMLYA